MEQLLNLPCIVESSIIAADENKQLPIPQGQLRVTLSYRDDVKVNDTFSMYNNTYKIRGIDYTKVINGKGIMVISS
jgi:pyrimidine operon attenuation protein/uracil phosphoribosyltransferase